MTGTVKEAFHVAAVAFVGWQHFSEKQSEMGRANMATGKREYLPEPTVEFSGQSLTLSQVCDQARVLSGELPPHLRALFVIIDSGICILDAETYPEAVEALAVAVQCEKDRQAASPLTEPTLIERIGASSYSEGFNAALGIMAGKAGSA